MKKFSERLKEIRKSAGLTQKQVAFELEIAESAYQNYERGSHLPSFDLLIKMANCFNVSLDYLVDREFPQ